MERTAIREAVEAREDPLFLFVGEEGAKDRFAEGAIWVEFGPDGRAWFIGMSPNASLILRYHGLDVFDTPARALFQKMSDADRSGEHTYTAVEYLFPNQILTLHEADRAHAKQGGKKRVIWGQVGIGSPAYFESISGKPYKRGENRTVVKGAERYVHAKFGGATLVGRTGDGDDETLELHFDDGVIRKLRRSFVTEAKRPTG